VGKYDGITPTPRKKRILTDRHGREMPPEPHLDVPMRRFWDGVEHDKLELILGEQDKYSTFIAALHDPAYSGLTFPTICRKFGVTLHELQSIYTDGMRQMSLLQLSSSLPRIMEDVAEDAKSKQVVCPRCDGEKVLIEVVERDEKGKPKKIKERSCPVCEGAGKVRQSGDKHARDLVFESMKLTGQKGPLVAINQQFNNDSNLDASMERMMKITQQITVGGALGETEEVR
jgi:hypothetical protein